MKYLFTLLLCAGLSGLKAQNHQQAYWLNAAVSTTGKATHYGGSLEANYALDQYVFSLGVDYYNLPSSMGNALKRDVYFTPGCEVAIAPNFSLGFRFGPALSYFETPYLSDDGGHEDLWRVYFPLKLRAAYNMSNNWGLYSEFTLLAEGITLNRYYFAGKLGLRFGRLIENKPLSWAGPDFSENSLALGAFAGPSSLGFMQGVEVAFNKRGLLFNAGYFGHILNREAQTRMDATYLGFGYRHCRKKFSASASTGLGYYFYQTTTLITNNHTIVEKFSSPYWHLQAGAAYQIGFGLETRLNFIYSPSIFDVGQFYFAGLGLAYRIGPYCAN